MKASTFLTPLCIIGLIGNAGAQSTAPVPTQSPSPLEIRRSKVRPAVEHIRNHLCPACPALDDAKGFYEFPGFDDILEGVKLNVKKAISVAGIEFDAPVTIYLKNDLPEKILISDRRNPRPARTSPIGLISAREIPITPDGKIATLTYPEDELKVFFVDKSIYSISEFFWDDTEKIVRPASFRAEKSFAFCGFKFEKSEMLKFTYDKTWEMVPIHPFTHGNKKYDGGESYRVTFSRQYPCRAKAYKYKTSELILFNNVDPTK